MRHRSVVLLSGGLDSAANLALCRERDEPVLALTANYGQRAAEPEIRAARGLCEYFRVEHRVIGLGWLGELGGSSLTEPAREVPRLPVEELDREAATRESAKAVWVPNRNGVLINMAAAFAERLDCERVVVGFNREEAATFPDNSEGFIRAANDAMRFSTTSGVQVFSYTSSWDKREMVSELRRLPVRFPFDRIWSCYLGGETPCESCESCRRRARALS